MLRNSLREGKVCVCGVHVCVRVCVYVRLCVCMHAHLHPCMCACVGIHGVFLNCVFVLLHQLA